MQRSQQIHHQSELTLPVKSAMLPPPDIATLLHHPEAWPIDNKLRDIMNTQPDFIDRCLRTTTGRVILLRGGQTLVEKTPCSLSKANHSSGNACTRDRRSQVQDSSTAIVCKSLAFPRQICLIDGLPMAIDRPRSNSMLVEIELGA
jgi:hypothetical protein